MKQEISPDITGEGGKLCKKELVIDDEPELVGEKMAISDKVAEFTFFNRQIDNYKRADTSCV